ncbi:MAG: hypothetical protein JXB10_18375 [Pirellulales bacterium]|nr:hypothetical protein [Pirellulales bacterium]
MITKKSEGERLLEINNVHFAELGPPPTIDATGKYVGYLENAFGEQWVFIGDRKTGEAVIRGGDADWANEFQVSRDKPCPVNLILGEEEKQWIITCFTAMTNTPFDVVKANFAAGDLLSGLLSSFPNG